MKRRALLIGVLCVAPVYASAHELTLMAGTDNFTAARTQAPPPQIDDTMFNIVGSIALSGDFAENIGYSLEAGGDSIWRNYLSGEAVFRFELLKFALGTFFQYDPKGKEFLSPAFIAMMGIEVPGAFFVDARIIMPLYENLEKQGNFGYNYLAFSIGYWTPHIIAGFFYDTRYFRQKRADTLVLHDSLTRYFLRAGVFDKNRFLTAYFEFGYETLTLELEETETQTDETQALFAGAEFVIRMSGMFALRLKGEIPFSMSYPDSSYLWYRLLAGFTIKLAD